MMQLQEHVEQGQKVYIESGSTHQGIVDKVDKEGIWIDKNPYWMKIEDRLLVFIPFAEINNWGIE